MDFFAGILQVVNYALISQIIWWPNKNGLSSVAMLDKCASYLIAQPTHGILSADAWSFYFLPKWTRKCNLLAKVRDKSRKKMWFAIFGSSMNEIVFWLQTLCFQENSSLISFKQQSYLRLKN